MGISPVLQTHLLTNLKCPILLCLFYIKVFTYLYRHEVFSVEIVFSVMHPVASKNRELL